MGNKTSHILLQEISVQEIKRCESVHLWGLLTRLMCLASYPPRLGRQGLFISKCRPSPLLMFSVTSKENECNYLGDRLLHRSGKSEVLSIRVALL